MTNKGADRIHSGRPYVLSEDWRLTTFNYSRLNGGYLSVISQV